VDQELSTAERRELARLEWADRGVRSLLEFIPTVTPWYRAPVFHLLPLAELFWQAGCGKRLRVLSSTPPQHGKTTSMLHWIVAYLKAFPWHNVAYVSYEAGVAWSKSREARDIAERAGLNLKIGSKSVTEWKTTDDGGFIATSIGGPLTSKRVDFLVVDDPHKDRVSAESPTYQNRAYEWFSGVAMSRLTKDASTIVNMARWAQGDLIGRLLDNRKVDWKVVNLKAIDIVDGQERALWESHKPLRFLREQRDSGLIHPYDWAALYEGNPQPRGGALFGEPERYDVIPMDGSNASGWRFAIACDPAATAKSSADHSAIVVVGATGDGADQKVYVLDVWRGQVEIPALVKELRRFQERWRCPVWIEAVGGFKAVPQMLREIGAASRARGEEALRVCEVTARGDKFTRALPVSAAWGDKRVLVPRNKDAHPWVREFLAEVKRFTGKGDAQDDQVDALSHAFDAVDRRVNAIERGVKRVSGSF
jgi:predicted phage terminase large subunit-like protein